MAMRKSLEKICGMILDLLQAKFVNKSVANEIFYLKIFFGMKIFLAKCYSKKSCTVFHNLTSKICPRVQVLTSHFSEVD